jgi:hypothetical protein
LKFIETICIRIFVGTKVSATRGQGQRSREKGKMKLIYDENE